MNRPNEIANAPEHDGFAMACRLCGARVTDTLVDLGVSPLCQTHIAPEALNAPEVFYPLHAMICRNCMLVQLQEYVQPAGIFSDYAYFSSYSDSWVAHAARYADTMCGQLGLARNSFVVEIASNDGYLLQHFVARGIPVLGVEPAANVAEVAIARGIRTRIAFFGRDTAREIVADFRPADLIAANNVLAHVPDLNDFVSGIRTLLAADGVVTCEFPHLQRLLERNQFDTIYHEHFSYFSWISVTRVFAENGLRLFDVEELPTHGGSLRIYGCRSESPRPSSARAAALTERERSLGYDRMDIYRGFGERVARTRDALLRFLIEARAKGQRVVGYGAPGKGNTLLNYCGIRPDLLAFTVDRNPVKQGKFTPGARIPILDPGAIERTKPEFVLILPWNLRDEIAEQLALIRAWGGRFVVPIPELEVF